MARPNPPRGEDWKRSADVVHHWRRCAELAGLEFFVLRVPELSDMTDVDDLRTRRFYIIQAAPWLPRPTMLMLATMMSFMDADVDHARGMLHSNATTGALGELDVDLDDEQWAALMDLACAIRRARYGEGSVAGLVRLSGSNGAS